MRQVLFLFRKTSFYDLSKRLSVQTSHLRKMSTLNFGDALKGPFNFVDNVRCDPVDAQTEGTFENLEPRSGKKISDVPNSGKEEIDRAVKAAKLAGSEWSKVDIKTHVYCYGSINRFPNPFNRIYLRE